jgi:hypothetical protein
MFVCSNHNTHTQTIYIEKNIVHTTELKSPCLWACFQNTLSSLSVVSIYKARKFYYISQHENSAFNAQGSRMVIVVVKVGIVKIYENFHSQLHV